MDTAGSSKIQRLLEPLRNQPGLVLTPLGPFNVGGREYHLPRFTMRGSPGAEIRVGLFAAIHGDEPAGAEAVVRFLQELTRDSELASDYLVHAYPVCNPTGFEDGIRFSRSGRDLNREFWKSSTEPEVRLLEQELQTQRFNGIVQLHADDTSEGIYGFVRGHTLTEHLLRPALAAAGTILPRNISAQIDGFAARDSIVYELYEGVLGAPAKIDPVPFEIVFETPGLAAIERQVEALVIALRTIFTEYRQLISFAQNI